MKRPFADQRILGPFAEGPNSGITFKAMFNARAASVANIEDELADNVRDKLTKEYSNVGDVSVTTRSSQITIRANTGEDTLTSDDEDMLIRIMKDEIERISQSEATNTGYEFSV